MHKRSILHSIRDNRDMIAHTDGEFSQTERVERRIDMDNYLPIKLY